MEADATSQDRPNSGYHTGLPTFISWELPPRDGPVMGTLSASPPAEFPWQAGLMGSFQS